MTTTSVSLCLGCVHYTRIAGRPTIDTTMPMRLLCTAFPTGIPVEILDGTVDHRQPYLGDHGVQFVEQFPDTAAAYDNHPRLVRSAPKTLRTGML